MRGVSRLGFLALVWVLCLPERSLAGDMDPALSRLRVPPGEGGCPDTGAFCPNDEAFERLISDLSAGVAPPVNSGAATLGLRGFAVHWSLSVTPISGQHWITGTEGPNPAGSSHNPSPNGTLTWNRLELRKGLPFGLEVGGVIGHGFDSSLWLLGAEIRAALFEGYRSGLGALPDVAVRGVMQTLVGSPDLSLHTLTFDVTLSKPYVIAGRHRVTPLIALQALFTNADTEPVDLTPDVSAWDECQAQPGNERCATESGANDLRNSVRFASLDQTRVRLFVGVEERYSVFASALTLGFDLTVPQRHAETANDGIDDDLPRSLTLHFALGLRY